jgi:hypothetical protein
VRRVFPAPVGFKRAFRDRGLLVMHKNKKIEHVITASHLFVNVLNGESI